VKPYKELIVWQKAVDLACRVYELTEGFPKTETYGLATQMRRSAVSIASYLAEESRRGTRKDFRHFVLIAFGLGAELETQLEITRRLPFSSGMDFHETDALLEEVMRMLNVLTQSLAAEVSPSYLLPTTR